MQNGFGLGTRWHPTHLSTCNNEVTNPTETMTFAVKNTATGKLVGEIDRAMCTIPDIRDAEKYPQLVNTFDSRAAAQRWADRYEGAGYGLTETEVVEFPQN